MKRSYCLALALLASLIGVSPLCRADSIRYVQAGVESGYSRLDQNGIPVTAYSDYWNQGASSASASGADPTHGSAASATATLFGADPGLHLFTQGVNGGNEQVAAAEWRDIIRIGGPGPHPSSIRATIDVSGSLEISAKPWQENVAAAVYIMPVHSFELIPNAPGSFLFGPPGNEASGFKAAYQRPDVGLEFYPSNMGGFQFIPGTTPGTYSLHWTATFDLPYSDVYDGYIFNIFGLIRTIGRGGTVITDFGDTFRLAGLTQADGSPLTGGVTFASGFQLQSVPEPSSVVMLGLGACGLIGIVVRRRAA